MKITSLITAVSVAIGIWTVPAAADPWKDESGHGRWGRSEYKEKHWKPHRKHYRRRYRRDDAQIYFEFRPAYRYRRAPAYRSAGNAHADWCYGRYRSYRAWDNTFQPYYGPRRQCISPYN